VLKLMALKYGYAKLLNALAHESRDDSVESAAFVVKFFAALPNALLASAQRTEVLCVEFESLMCN